MKLLLNAQVMLISILALSQGLHAQDLRGSDQLTNKQQKHRELFWDWFFGNDDNDNDNNNNNGDSGNQQNGGFFGVVTDIWNGIFGSNDETGQETTNSNPFSDFWNNLFGGNNGTNSSNPFADVIKDLNNITNSIIAPIQEAFNATEGSEQPLKDFLQELLDQPSSDEPVRDFIREALNRTDTPVLDFLADLFNTTNNPVDDFVREILNGTTSPVQDFFNNLSDEVVFEEKDCSVQNANAPACAYNWQGDAGVWVCRTFYNPLTGDPVKETICAPPEFILKNNDVCGSCDNTYPTGCSCTCDLDEPGAGTYVQVGPVTQCVDSKWAVGNAGRFAISCQEECQ